MSNWREHVRKVVPYVPGEQPNKPGMIKLNTNENPYPPAPGVQKVLEEFSADSLRLYPDPAVTELTECLAEYYGFSKDQVFVGVGSDDVLAMAFMTFFNSEKPILFPDISYSFYSVWAEEFRIPYTRPALDENFKLVKEDYYQENGDYRRSWQPQPVSEVALEKAREIARKITDALGGYGIFGVELFVKGDDVIFSEVSPRPHDTGMVTMISQHLSEFALHVRALLGLPIPEIKFYGPSASRALLAEGNSRDIVISGMENALARPGTDMRIFGKPEVQGHRRVGVMLATAETVGKACRLVDAAAADIKIECR